jgi:hypothetical protein
MKYHIRANGTPLCSWLKTVSHEKEEFHRQLESLDSEAIYGVVIQLENTWPDVTFQVIQGSCPGAHYNTCKYNLAI